MNTDTDTSTRAIFRVDSLTKEDENGTYTCDLIFDTVDGFRIRGVYSYSDLMHQIQGHGYTYDCPIFMTDRGVMDGKSVTLEEARRFFLDTFDTSYAIAKQRSQ